MNLPKVIEALVTAQNNADGAAYANCFTATATVADEGHTHTGKTEIQQWIEKANEAYNAVMKPISYTAAGNKGTLSAEISGTFPGSPLVLHYDFEFVDGLIGMLRIG